MTERDDLQEQASTVAETTTTETTSTAAVGEAPTDPAEEKRVQPAEALESQRTVTETQEVSTDDVADAAEVLGSPEPAGE